MFNQHQMKYIEKTMNELNRQNDAIEREFAKYTKTQTESARFNTVNARLNEHTHEVIQTLDLITRAHSHPHPEVWNYAFDRLNASFSKVMESFNDMSGPKTNNEFAQLVESKKTIVDDRPLQKFLASMRVTHTEQEEEGKPVQRIPIPVATHTAMKEKPVQKIPIPKGPE